ncbi:MAG: lysozyme inhibitor LprI family protein [Lachnospiraceae bacterium]|nr:lysozyme inhibitor LprI family protein [Lachnospiraceae bacterium]
MKRDYKIWAVILGIIIAGVGITTITNSYVSGQSTRTAVYEAAAMEDVDMDAAEAEAVFDSGSRPDIQAAGGIDSGAKGEHEEGSALLSAQGQQAEIAAAAAAEPEAWAAEDAAEDGSAELAADGEAYDGSDRLDDSDGGSGAAGGRMARSAETEAAAFGESYDKSETDGAGTAGQGNSQSGTVFTETAAAKEAEMKKSADAPESQITVSSSVTINEASLNETADYQEKLRKYQERLAELDAQIERMRSSETDNTVHSVKSAAQTEQRIWERELDAVYTLLIGSLDEESGKMLRAEQQKWIISRDQKAQEASKKNSGGSMESVEYIASIAASTRERVYALVEQYR